MQISHDYDKYDENGYCNILWFRKIQKILLRDIPADAFEALPEKRILSTAKCTEKSTEAFQ